MVKLAFLVSIWVDGSGDAPAAWRGCVEHIASGRRLYFNEVASLIRFMLGR